MPEVEPATFEEAFRSGWTSGAHVPYREHVPLAPYTTWGIGGPAERLVEPVTPRDLGAALAHAHRDGSPLTVLGRGSNALIDDHGIPGTTILLRTALDAIHHHPERPGTYTVQAGCPLPKLAATARRDGIADFEFLIGIPGTVGAGVAINAGIGGEHGTAIDTLLMEVLLLDPETGSLHHESADRLGLAYRHSNVPERGLWVVQATLRGTPADADTIKRRQREILKNRADKQPLQRKTSGSVFKQPQGGHAAGWYLDRAGLKGTRVGNAVVSERHANWIENHGNATARDVRALIRTLQDAVHAEFGIHLEREVRYHPEDVV